jgi:Ca2+-binding EF-hand superfamily protein
MDRISVSQRCICLLLFWMLPVADIRAQPQLDASVVSMLREVFNSYDTDRSGSIDKREVDAFCPCVITVLIV